MERLFIRNRTAIRLLSGLADALQAVADFGPYSIEIVTSDHSGKRPRRSKRTITRPAYKRQPRVTIQNHYHISRVTPIRRAA
jgi:hypothetical protein